MSLFSCLVPHTSDSSFWLLLVNPRRRKTWVSHSRSELCLSKVGTWTQGSIRYRGAELQVLAWVVKSVPSMTPATWLWTPSYPTALHSAQDLSCNCESMSQKEFTTSFLKRLQNKQNKHQLVSAGCTLACLEEGDARDSFCRLLTALHF